MIIDGNEYKWEDIQIVLPNSPIPIEISHIKYVSKPKWEFYLKRNNKLYFRNKFSGQTLVFDLKPEDFKAIPKDFKYGTKVDFDLEKLFNPSQIIEIEVKPKNKHENS